MKRPFKGKRTRLVCPDCGKLKGCDEDGCCPCCGRDLFKRLQTIWKHSDKKQ
jgi:ribosomal protein L37AE/L43A